MDWAAPLLTRRNRSKTCSISSAGMPRPVSVTLISANPPSARVDRVTVPPSGEYLTALLTRLVTTWTSRSRSPLTMGRRGSSSALNSATTADEDEALVMTSLMTSLMSTSARRMLIRPDSIRPRSSSCRFGRLTRPPSLICSPPKPGQRGPELVADDGEKLGLGSVQLLERGEGATLGVERLGEPVLGFADGGHILNHDEHVLGTAARVGDRGGGQLEPQPASAAGGSADLDAALIGDSGQQRRQAGSAGRLVIRPKQVGPRLRAHRLHVVLQHLEERWVPLEQLAFAAHARDSDRGAFVDRTMVRLASAQRLRDRGTLDVLADLDPDGGQHGEEVGFGVPNLASQQLDDADRRSPADEGKGNSGPQAGTALSARLLVILRRQVVEIAGDARLPDPAHQAATHLDRKVSNRVVEVEVRAFLVS